MNRRSNQSKNNVGIMLIIAIALSSIVIILKNYYFSAIPSYLLITFFLFFMLLLKSDHRIIYYFFLIPCNIASNLYVIHVAFLIISLYENLRKNKINTFKVNAVIILAIVLIFYEIILELIYPTIISINTLSVLGFVVCVVILLILGYGQYDVEGGLYKTIVAWTIGVIVLALCMAITQFSVGGFAVGDIRLGSPVVLHSANYNGQMWQDSNYLAMYALTGIAGLMIMARKYRSKVSILLAAILLIIGLATGSRGFLLAFIFAFLLNIFFMPKSKKAIISGVVVIAISFFVFMQSDLSTYFNNMYAVRMDTADVSNGRLDLYSEYTDILMNNPPILLYGTGLVDYPIKINSMFNKNYLMVHNSIIEIVVMWGLTGFIILLFIATLIYRKIFYKISRIGNKIEIISPLLIFILSTLTITIFYSYYSIMPILYLVISESRYISTNIRINNKTTRYLENTYA